MHRTEIILGDDATAQRQAILDRLSEFNASRGPPGDAEALCVALVDDGGAVAGGLYATLVYGWLVVELLFVPEQLRGTGLGSKLLADAEDQARARGCIGAWLDTFSFQARGFYEKLGYSLAGTIPDHPPGGARHFMVKRWSGPA
jgi:GNAT superfamily N-acetyltransferase